MCAIVKNAKMECCNHMDIMIPSLSKYDLEYLVEFLYSGQISCSDQETVSKVVSNLSKFLGFPDSMDLSTSPDLPQNFCGNFQENENFEDENKEFDYEDTESNEIGVKVEFTEGWRWFTVVEFHLIRGAGTGDVKGAGVSPIYFGRTKEQNSS